MPETKHGIVQDLGMRPNGPWQARFCIVECPQCQGHRKMLMAVAKRSNGCCRGCWLKSLKAANRTHGLWGTRIYKLWDAMRWRCKTKAASHYRHYGARRITVCDEWEDVRVFRAWAMGHGYQEGLSLDRIDNDGNYEPGNCRWVTQTIQTQNSVLLRRNNTSGYRGVFLHKPDRWCAAIGVKRKKQHLGLFDRPEDAAKAYDAFVVANGMANPLNFPEAKNA